MHLSFFEIGGFPSNESELTYNSRAFRQYDPFQMRSAQHGYLLLGANQPFANLRVSLYEAANFFLSSVFTAGQRKGGLKERKVVGK